MCEISDIDSAWADFASFRRENEKEVKVDICNEFFCKCGGVKIVVENVHVCHSCGLVDKNTIDDSPEWTSGVSEDGVVSDPSRCGMPTDTELFSEQWGAGLMINSLGASYAVKRMAKINFHSSMNHKDRSLFHAYKDIELAALTNLNLPATVVRDAKVMYKKFNAEKLTRGAVRSGVKANCVLAACKLSNWPRTTKDIADAFGIPVKDVSRTSQLFRETILGESAPKITKPFHVVTRLLNDFSFENRSMVGVKCRKMCEKLEPCVKLMGKTPTSIASAVIFIVTGISKQEIASTCKVSLPTLNKIESLVKEYLEATPATQ